MKEKFSKIRAKAKLKSAENHSLKNSDDYKRIIGLLSGLGFLVAPNVKSFSTAKIDTNVAISIGRLVEPRILEVLPAAVVSFPKSFLHLDKTPTEFQEIVSALKSGRTGPSFEGISFEKFYEAANRPIKNKKRKIISKRRIPRTFRFTPETIQLLLEQSIEAGTNNTTYLEMLISREGVQSNN